MSSSSCSRRPPCSDRPAASPALYAAVAASHMSPASFVSTCMAENLLVSQMSPQHVECWVHVSRSQVNVAP